LVSAEDYDEFVNYASWPPDTVAEVECLTELAAGGRVLELGAGTGRVAIPLAAKGPEVHAIEVDPAMIRQMLAKPGSERVITHLGDMADMDVDSTFDLIFAVFGTLFMLPTQDKQIRCFRSAARRLAPSGSLVIEALMPQPSTYDQHRKVTVGHVADDRVVLNVAETDPVAQTIDTRQVVLSASGIQVHPVHIRYSWPSELDLMARLAGLELRARWSDWDRRPFAAGDQRHISVYQRPIK
jgi:SAM-dependent methyltransferase